MKINILGFLENIIKRKYILFFICYSNIYIYIYEIYILVSSTKKNHTKLFKHNKLNFI